MEKRIVVAGCRNYFNYEQAKAFIDFCLKNIKDEYTLIFVSGGAPGADALGERYALEHGYKVERYNADWEKYGRSAGPIRNEEMAKAADFVICFWDGKSRGTKSMIGFAEKYEKPIKIKRVP